MICKMTRPDTFWFQLIEAARGKLLSSADWHDCLEVPRVGAAAPAPTAGIPAVPAIAVSPPTLPPLPVILGVRDAIVLCCLDEFFAINPSLQWLKTATNLHWKRS